VKNLCEMMAVKTLMRQARLLSLQIRGDTLELCLDPAHPPDPDRLMRLARGQSERLSIDQQGLLRLRLSPEERQELLPAVRTLLSRLLN
jgi:transcription-repair coupling factor (superfamily II helicase)